MRTARRRWYRSRSGASFSRKPRDRPRRETSGREGGPAAPSLTGIANRHAWHRPRCDGQQRGGRGRLHAHRDRDCGRDRGNDGRGRIRNITCLALAGGVDGGRRVRPLPRQRAHDGARPGRRDPRLHPGRVRRRHRGTSARGRPERPARADDAPNPAHARNDRRNGVARQSTVRIHRTRKRIAQRTPGLSRRRCGRDGRRLPREWRIPFRDQGGRRKRRPLRPLPHEAGSKRPGGADDVAAHIPRAESDTMQRAGLYGDVASGRADVDGQLSAEFHGNPGRLRTGTAGKFNPALSRNDQRRTGIAHRWRNRHVHRTSDADESKRGRIGHPSIDPSQRANGRHDMHRNATRLAAVRIEL